MAKLKPASPKSKLDIEWADALNLRGGRIEPFESCDYGPIPVKPRTRRSLFGWIANQAVRIIVRDTHAVKPECERSRKSAFGRACQLWAQVLFKRRGKRVI
jgi:hypothetical protein